MLLNDNGLMVGVDYTNQYFSLPLQWFVIAVALLSAVLVLTKYAKWAAIVALAVILKIIVPPIVNAVYVRPNEITLEKPFIKQHIDATRSPFALDRNMTDMEYQTKPNLPINVPPHRPPLTNLP